jgi:hypothetical protein
MDNGGAHLAVYGTLTDSEVGHLLVELHTRRFTGTGLEVVTVAESPEPITTKCGVRVLPDALLADPDPAAKRPPHPARANERERCPRS